MDMPASIEKYLFPLPSSLIGTSFQNQKVLYESKGKNLPICFQTKPKKQKSPYHTKHLVTHANTSNLHIEGNNLSKRN